MQHKSLRIKVKIKKKKYTISIHNILLQESSTMYYYKRVHTCNYRSRPGLFKNLTPMFALICADRRIFNYYKGNFYLSFGWPNNEA
jgi:hypothetical protein